MRRIQIIIVLLFVLPLSVNAQNVSFEWGEGFGGGDIDDANSIVVDILGNSYIVGNFWGTVIYNTGSIVMPLVSEGLNDVFILKLDSTGAGAWIKQIGDISYDEGFSITIDAFGDVLVTGRFTNTVDFGLGGNATYLSSSPLWKSDVFILKINTNGNLIWAKSMGGVENDASKSIATDKVGNVYTTGFYQGAGPADFDPGAGVFNLSGGGYFIQKLDKNGNFFWAKGGIGGRAGGDDIAVDEFGSVLVTGSYFGTTDFDPGPNTFNVTSSNSNDIYIQKLDSNGNFIWAKSMGGASNDAGVAITTDSFGNVYTTGMFSGTADFDPGIGSDSLTPVGSLDVFIQKLDSNGDLVWAKSVGGTSMEVGTDITVDINNNIYLTGWFRDTVDFDSGVGVFNLSAFEGAAFALKLNSLGDFKWAKSFAGSAGSGRALFVDQKLSVYVVGSFTGTADLDPDTSTNIVVSGGGSRDYFIIKLSQDFPVGIVDRREVKNLTIYPNPASQQITIDNKQITIASIEINDITGKLIKTINPTTNTVDVSDLPSGIYFLQITTANGTIITQKFIKK
ncbi:MAG: hypothetical protein COA97_03350 [Flavobacteriales bacterium]|nr:MAG: hypothetical protein COA97_03350 [Flavobacteriales bacterium]